jgi:UDP-N-acetylglucosamine--N-acetylmuramyl-(pentapeptide) pyrophosphoryl-undecaprenol N-acetylglucosamine transferase
MKDPVGEEVNVAIACGGTGGHLFPGLAVGEQLIRLGAKVTLIISAKEVDQLAVKNAANMKVLTLPAMGLTRGRFIAFLRSSLRSFQVAARWFAEHPPQAVLAMGGFTSAPPILAGRRYQSMAFLHESNTVPGRANRWLSWGVERAFVGFPSAVRRLHCRRVVVTGTPVRPGFRPGNPAIHRNVLGLDPSRAVVLVMGGSQGARGINELVMRSVPLLAQLGPDWQWVHLAGAADVSSLQSAYATKGLVAKVYSFLPDMEAALGAATASISRAGASSLAELAASRVPSLLIPFPAATDNHQFENARAFEKTGAARLLEERNARPEDLARSFRDLMLDEVCRQNMQTALGNWHKPEAAEQIAQAMLESIRTRVRAVPTSNQRAPNSRSPEQTRPRQEPTEDSRPMIQAGFGTGPGAACA